MNSQTVAITEAVLAKLKDLPLEQQQQILDFVEFIEKKYVEKQLNQSESSGKRIAGLQKGKIWISEDFNEPLELKKIEE
ncbi:MAG: DUF2281 domain-containing protein [Xenococcaceae cyanobacterium MO_234.B1]|nr:DUF2281 domain-containing protein [Xenococcaceae cyanobacterium MO_234.B1]